MKDLFKKSIIFSILCCSLIFCCDMQAWAKGKYDASLYQDVLNYPACYSGKVQFERISETTHGEKVTLADNENLKYIIKDITGDGIEELLVMDSQHLFIFTQKYSKKTKNMKVSVMTVLRLVDPPTIYYKKSGSKRYLCIDYGYAGTGTRTKLIYQGKGTKLTLKNTLLYGGNWQGYTDEGWSINGKTITQKKYNSYVKKYFAKKYKVNLKTKSYTYVTTPAAFDTMTDKLAPSIVIIGSYAEKNVWTTQARTFMATYVMTRYQTYKSKVKLSTVKKEMKSLFGTNKVKFSQEYPYNSIKKKGKWVTAPQGELGAEVPYCSILNTCKISNGVYRTKCKVYTVIEGYSSEPYGMKNYYITFKKSDSKYGYIIKDICEVK